MTIIVAQKTTTGVLLGADQSMSEPPRIFRRTNPKLVSITPRIAVGTAGIARLGSLIREPSFLLRTFEGVDLEFHLPMKPDYAFVRSNLAARFRDLLKDEEKAAPVWALIAIDREIFYVGAGGDVTHVNAPYCALGNAETVALGALYVIDVMADLKLGTASDAVRRLTLALEASAEHIEAIRPPWTFVETRASDA